MLGHGCWYYLIAQGKDPMQHDHAKDRYKTSQYPAPMSQARDSAVAGATQGQELQTF